MIKVMKPLFCVCLAILLLPSTSFSLGSGAIGNESGISTKATSHGYAFTGVADDPSAIFYNPAGLVQVKGLQMMGGTSVLSINSEHTTPSGVTDKMAPHLPLAPYFYASFSGENSPFAFGIGVNSPFGLITEWKDNSFSKYYATKSELLMYMINPSIAYSLRDNLMIGTGLDYFNVFRTELNQKVFNGPGNTDGDSKFSVSGHAWGYNAGILWKTSSADSVGLTYRSQANVPLRGDVMLSNLSGIPAFIFGGSSFQTGASTEIKFPQNVTVGYGHKFDRCQFFLDYEWVNWATTDSTDFNFGQNNPGLTQSIPRHWRNTNNLGTGIEWHQNQFLDLRAGALVYETVVPSGTLESSIPDAGRVTLTVGTGMHFSDFSVDLGYQADFLKNRNIQNSAGNAFASMNGEFKSQINIFSVGVSQKWGGAH